MGIDMLVNALLKACGFSRDQLMESIEYGKQEFEFIKGRAINLDERIIRVENNQVAIYEILGRIEKRLAEMERLPH